MSIFILNRNLEKPKQLLTYLSYKVGYKKDNFKSNFCLMKSGKMVMVNKFFNTERKIIASIKLIKVLEVAQILFYKKQKQLYYSLQQTSIQF